jgi:hypothetical protein
MTLFSKICLLIACVASGAFVIYSSSIAIAAETASSTSQGQVCKGVNINGSETCDDGGSINKLLKTILSVISWVAGIITIIMIVIAGIKFSTSTGDSAKVTSAKSTLTFALVGAVVVILAQVIVRFVINQVD